MEHKVYKIEPQISPSALAKARNAGFDRNSLPSLFTSTDEKTREKYKGCRIVDFKMMPIDQVKQNLTLFQCRAQTIDQNHVANLTKDIKERGHLLEPVITELYNKVHITADGHHRVEACKDLRYTHIPVFIIEFDSPLDRSRFIRKAQDRPPAKPNSKEDAAIFLDELHTSHNLFANCTDEEKRAKAYTELKDSYGYLGQQKLIWVVRKWMQKPSSQKKFDTRTLKNWQRKIVVDHKSAGKEIKWGQINNGELNLAFQDNGISQCLGQIIDVVNDEVTRLKGLRSYKDPQVAERIANIKIIVHGSVYAPTDLNTRRSEVTQRWESYNKNKVVNFIVSQINWQAQQLQPSQEQSQILKWDFTEEKFI